MPGDRPINVPATPSSQNFAFLGPHWSQLERLAALAERSFADDPVVCLIRLRQFGEALAQEVAARVGLLKPDEDRPAEARQFDLLRRLQSEGVATREVLDMLHDIRRVGNIATHDNAGTHATALTALKFARLLAIWLHRSFVNAGFKAGPFIPPQRPPDPTVALQAELDRLRAERDAALSQAERDREARQAEQAARMTAEERAADIAVWEQLAAEAEAGKLALAAELASLQQAAAAAPPAQQALLLLRTQEAAAQVDLDEADTRILIDLQLRRVGWEADTPTLRHAAGVRPARGRNLAIAEWPTANGPADYALFVGLTCVGIVEAKRRNRDVAAHIDQAGRYAQGFLAEPGITPAAGGPWPADTQGQEPPYRLPFLFSTNGRAPLKQLASQSGIWFRDARDPTNLRRPLADWYSPDGLLGLLGQDRTAAQAELALKPFDFGFELRPYQRRAIEAVETALTADSCRALLLAMATGTGKTKLAIAMLYRLLATKRFLRVCFVVDRTSLGEQAAGEFRTTRIIGANTFAEIFGLRAFGTGGPDESTKVDICTIQSLVKRVTDPATPDDLPQIDSYDLMVIDECHRGYTLDRELSDQELSFRDEADYLSKYRRALDHFDAVKIGLTATPALHTTQIFGPPIFTYGLREAVIDGYLIDQEPPIRIETALSVAGIHFPQGADMPLLDPITNVIDLTTAPADVDFEVDSFNRRVITEEFNRVVAEELARHIDPSLPGKTLVFATTDKHADIVVNALKTAFRNTYGAIDDSAIAKITGQIDRPGQMIRRFRNDALPSIAVTVDLLTTGIDVPSIVNLVFLRRVNSRILYDQMIGRATRRCDEIGKETFRVFDAVRQYDAIQAFTNMKPVVTDPNLPFATLIRDLINAPDPASRALVRDQLLVRLRRRLRKLTAEAVTAWESEAGETPQETLTRVQTAPPEDLATWLAARPNLAAILDWRPQAGTPMPLVVSFHPDSHHATTIGYGSTGRPEDYLSAFAVYLRENGNRLAALSLALTRPRALTRAALKELAMALQEHQFTEATLRAAHRDASNQDIAAGLIGFIRQAALGDALEPWETRVDRAIQRLKAREAWTAPQRHWLDRIGRLVAEMGVADPALLNEGLFGRQGGAKRLNTIFAGRLDDLLGDINEEVWKPAA